jgi:hypothetical protein
MSHQDGYPCKWCGQPIANRKDGQKFCSDEHRYAFHRSQRISPAQFDERVRAIVRQELKTLGLQPTGGENA